MKWGAYMWTASAGGWFVLAYVTKVPEAVGVGVGCLFMAAMWVMIWQALEGG